MDLTFEGIRVPQKWYIHTVKSMYEIENYIYINIYKGK